MNTKKGFTLIELLVVMVIISMLAVLLMPAINAARETARKTKCTSNLRQFGIAFSTYEANNGAYPPSRSSNKRASWTLALLDYLDLKSIASQYDETKTFCEGKTNQMLMRKRLAIFQCPATPEPNRMQYLQSGNSFASGKVADANGVDDYAKGSCIDYYVHHMGITIPTRNGALKCNNPLAGFNAMTPATDIVDGLSNTIILDEMAGRPNRWAAGKRDRLFANATAGVGQCGNQPGWCSWGGCASNTLSAWDETGQYSYSSNPTKDNFAKIVNATNDGVYAFHPGGSNALFMDGTVRFCSDMVIPEVYLALSARDSGLTYMHDDLEKKFLIELYPDKIDQTGLGRTIEDVRGVSN